MGLIYVPLAQDLEIMRRPFGELYEGRELEGLPDRLRKMAEEAVICSVGDVVTSYLLKNGLFPNVAVTDGKTLRSGVGLSKAESGYRVIEVHNPPGTVSAESLSVVTEISQKINRSSRFWIMVDGEEDLLALPIIALFPASTITLYGQPKRGVVLVTGNAKKEEALKILERMQVARRD
ncbi:DUF359 domain-containing protein [Tardisphaera miroshnichenkoae]